MCVISLILVLIVLCHFYKQQLPEDEQQFCCILMGVLAVALVCYIYRMKRYSEGFTDTSKLSFCQNCRTLDAKSCADCPNCGICTDPFGNKTCEQGDEIGPYFKDNCAEWDFNGNVMKITCPDCEAPKGYNKYVYEKRLSDTQTVNKYNVLV